MELKQLQYFVSVAEHASFTRAAQSLGVAQPALSRQVRLLEVALRQTLLRRNGRGAVPTEAGKLLLEHARGILHQMARATEDMAQLRGGTSGRVALGLPPSLARVLTLPLTRAFRDCLPSAQLTLREGLSVDLHEALRDGRLDLAVLYNASASDGLDIQPLLTEELVLVQQRPPGLAEDPPPPPMHLRELAKLPLVMPSRPNAIRMHVEAQLALLGCQPHTVLEIDGVPAILDLVAEGVGNALLSRNAVAHSLKPSAYRLRHFAKPALSISLSLVTSSRRTSNLAQQTALELVRSIAQQKLTTLT